eukprot:TRINITY_DN59_c0_g1_i1.p2 TRINITY_DN59_c0_g1~~TRINITY_DN59_c0_g1_i1.p2  ORF type:complete len:185 (+),score=40.40 TRINITY_DN59_c0_g1_i1:68-622(+)
MNSLRILFSVAILLVISASAAQHNVTEVQVGDCGGRLNNQQCNRAWAGQRIGTCSETICKIGCAMSSVANALPHTNGGNAWTPGTLDHWLTTHGGYSSGCLIIWSTVRPLGLIFEGQGRHSLQDLINIAGDCKKAAIVNVRAGHHWVLITGYAGNGNFHVSDPANFASTYAYNGMGLVTLYHYA